MGCGLLLACRREEITVGRLLLLGGRGGSQLVGCCLPEGGDHNWVGCCLPEIGVRHGDILLGGEMGGLGGLNNIL